MAFRNLKKEQFIHSNFPYCNYSLDYTLDSLQRIGAERIEFYGAHPHFCMEDVTYEDMKTLRHKLDSHGLRVVEINPENCAYPVNLASTNPATALRTFRYYENAIRTAGVLETPYVLVFPGYANADGDPREAWERSVQAMWRLADIAAVEGVTITFEATTPNLTVVSDHRKVMQMIQDCGRDNMAVTIDLMCLSQTGESVRDVYDICGADRVVNVHYTDGALLPSGSWEHRIPGEGDLYLEPLLAQFDENGYPGCFGNEVKFSIDPTVNTPEKTSAKLQRWWDSHFE